MNNVISIFKFGEDLNGSIYNSNHTNDRPVKPTSKPKQEIQLRDYQNDAVSACLRDLRSVRSSLLVLATGLGKTILFSKIIEQWDGRVLVLVHLEELLQNAYTEIESITGEVLGIERQSDKQLGERIVVALTLSLINRLHKFSKNHFSLIIVDEAHHAASELYHRIFSHFETAKVIGLTATDSRADGKALPFAKCSYRMGIREGVDQGYLVPVRGRRVIVDAIDLTKVKRKNNDAGDFDDSALDDEMVKGAAAIADIIYNDHAFDKGILFFPGCQSAKLTSEFLNKKSEGISVYIDSKITGSERRHLVGKLRKGEANWLCNVGIATEGFNWCDASVIGMCSPTLSRPAYVQRAGRGTRPLAGLLNGLSTSRERISAIGGSSKPYMTILDFTGVSANLNLMSYESVLNESTFTHEKDNEQEKQRQEEADDGVEQDDCKQVQSISFGGPGFVSRVQSKTLHSIEEFDPVNDGSEFRQEKVKLVTATDTGSITDKQYNLLVRNGIDDTTLSRFEAQKMVKFIAGHGFRIGFAEKALLKKIYKDVISSREASID